MTEEIKAALTKLHTAIFETEKVLAETNNRVDLLLAVNHLHEAADALVAATKDSEPPVVDAGTF